MVRMMLKAKLTNAPLFRTIHLKGFLVDTEGNSNQVTQAKLTKKGAKFQYPHSVGEGEKFKVKISPSPLGITRTVTATPDNIPIDKTVRGLGYSVKISIKAT